MVVGFIYSLVSVAYSVAFLRGTQGASKSVKKAVAVAKGKKAAAPKVKPFADATLSMLLKGSVITGIVSILANNNGYEYADRLQTIFHTIATFTTYVWGANTLPAEVTKIFHPLVVSCLLTLGVIKFTGYATTTDFIDVLKSYRVKSYDLMKLGAGDVLMFLLGPSVVSFALAMYDRRKLLKENFFIVISSMLVSSIGCLYGTAAIVRLIALGGSGDNAAILRLSLLPRNVTTALGIAIANIFGGDVAIAARYVHTVHTLYVSEECDWIAVARNDFVAFLCVSNAKF